MLRWRYAIRGLLRTPTFALTAVLTLALAIAANTTIFSIVDALLLRALPFPNPDRLAMVWLSWPAKGFPRLPVFRSLYFQLAEKNHSFAQLAAFRNGSVNLTVPGHPRQLQAARVTSTFFDVLGVPVQLGRTFTRADDAPESEPVVVLSDRLWSVIFARDPRSLGRTLPIDGVLHTVIGVMPREFRFSIEPGMGTLEFRARDLWLPLRLTPQDRLRSTSTDLQLLGRLKPAAVVSGALAEAEVIRAAHDAAAGIRSPMQFRIEGLPDEFQRDLRPGLRMLFGAAGCVLLIACANLANLLLARHSRRRGEFALQLALGARKGILVRQALTESLLISLAAGILGVALGAAFTRALAPWLPAGLVRARAVAMNLDSLAFAVTVCLLSVFLFGLGPAFASARTDAAATLRDSAIGGGGRRAKSFGDAVVICEIALASCLMIVAAFLAQSLLLLQTTATGFDQRYVFTGDTALLASQYATPASRIDFFDRLTAQAGRLPGVLAAGVVDYVPFGLDSYETSFQIEGRPQRGLEDAPLCARWTADPGYLAAMGIPLLDGRWFQRSDDAGAPPVAVVDEVAAQRYWPGERPVGRRITFNPSAPTPPYTIVGVVGGIRHTALNAEPRPGIYLPIRQKTPRSASLLVRATPGAPIGAAALRAAIGAVDATQPLEHAGSMERLVRDSLAVRRFQVWMVTAAAFLAMILSVVGIYGVMACQVAGRTPEIGVRMALGACARDILLMVLRRGMLLTLVGEALGVIAVLGLGQVVKSHIHGVTMHATTLLLGASVVWCASTLACLIPALRAARMEPLRALRLVHR